MLPGNVYNFGEVMPELLHENSPQLAQTVKGKVRVALEQQLRQADLRSVVIRVGDFFGAGRGNWFDQVIVKDIQKGRLVYPGANAVTTPWAYLPDLARCFVAVAQQRAKLERFEVLHFAGHQLSAQDWQALLEMRYLWQRHYVLANDRLIGSEPHTPLPKAAQAALSELGLLAPAC